MPGFRFLFAFLGIACFLFGACPIRAEAGLPVESLQLAVGFGVEQEASPERDILDLWRRYLTEPSDSIRATLWSGEERSSGPGYDLVAPYVYQGFRNFTVVHLGPAPGLDDTYVIRTLVSAVDDSTLDVRPLSLYRVYAIREGDGWVLGNALPRATRDWQRVTLGKVTFVCPQAHDFDRDAAKATAAWADSLARAFELPEPEPVTYYFTEDMAEMLRIMGLDFFPIGSDVTGGRSSPGRREAYAGIPGGEGYRHELAHILLLPELSHHPHRLVSEGLMTWTGGSNGLEYRDLLPGLAQYLSDHPDLTLEGLLEDPPLRRGDLDVGYRGLAVLCRTLFDRRGLDGVRSILAAGRDPETIVTVASKQLGVPPEELNRIWRKECGLP